MADPMSRSGHRPDHRDAAAPGHDHGSTHGQGMPVADRAGGIGPAVEDPLHAAAHSATGGLPPADAVHHGHDQQDAHSGHARHGGHAGHGDDHVAMFRRLFWIMLALAVPTVLLSGMFADIVGYTLPEIPGLAWVSPVLGTVIYVWGGRPFLTGAIGEIRAR